jgi:hypothetical protein
VSIEKRCHSGNARVASVGLDGGGHCPVEPKRLLARQRTGQVDLLKADNVASEALPEFREHNMQPKTVEEIVPTYIGPSRERSRTDRT